MNRGEQIVDPEKWEALKGEMKSITIGGFLKESWYWLLAVALAYTCGWLLGGRWAEIQCNNFIIETYVQPVIDNATNYFGNLSFS